MYKCFSLIAAVLFAAVAAGSCGYRLARFDNPALEGATTIAIPYFENKTYEPGLEAIFTHAFVTEFVESRRLQVVGEDGADLVLRGKIRQLDDDSIAWTRDDRSLEWRVWITIGVVVEECRTGRVLWKRGSLRHGEEFRTGTDIQLDETDKRRAFQDLARDLAERVHEGLMQGF